MKKLTREEVAAKWLWFRENASGYEPRPDQIEAAMLTYGPYLDEMLRELDAAKKEKK